MTEFARSTALSHIEARRSCREISCYRPHTHDALSIGAIDAGRTRLTGASGGAVFLEPGDVILIPAGRVHACNPDGGRWRYQMAHVDAGWAAGLGGPPSVTPPERGSCQSGPDTRRQGVASSTDIRVYRGSGSHDAASRWIDLVFADADAEELEQAFRALLARLDRCEAVITVPDARDLAARERLGPVLSRLRNEPGNPPLAALAAIAGIDRFQLVREVKRATGLPPLAWRQNERVLRARALLRGGASISDTAHALGFSDQSHLHRVFRAHVATSPGAYRGASLGAAQERTRRADA